MMPAGGQKKQQKKKKGKSKGGDTSKATEQVQPTTPVATTKANKATAPCVTPGQKEKTAEELALELIQACFKGRVADLQLSLAAGADVNCKMVCAPKHVTICLRISHCSVQ